MKIRLFFLSLFLLIFCQVKGQMSQAEKSILQVYSRLISSIGDLSRVPPTLELVNSKEFVAQYIPSRNLIQFEYAAYSICQELGPDSLDGVAFIIGHELGHYYRNHSWLAEAGSAYASLEMGEKLASAGIAMDTLEGNEAEADEFACFYSKLAGYSIGNTDNLLDRIYKGYNLPENINRYPKLKDRKAIAKGVKEKTSELNDIFEFANVLLLNRQYESASFLYKQILVKGFGSREIYNNIGVAKALKGLEYVEDDLRKISYPFELDFKSRLNDNTRSMSEEDSLKSAFYFSEAEDQFERAYQIDKEYIPAQMNLILCKALKGEIDEAEFLIKKITKAIQANNKFDKNGLDYVTAIIAYINGDKLHALEEFKRLAADGNSYAIKSLTSLTRNKNNITTSNVVQSSCFDTLRSFLPIFPVRNPGNKKTNFNGSDGSVSILAFDTLDINLYYFDFKGPGGFRRIFTLYKIEINNLFSTGSINAILQKGNLFSNCKNQGMQFHSGLDTVSYFIGDELNVCLFGEKSMAEQLILLKN